MDAPEIIEVDEDVATVHCDGGGGALGHPLVYYTFAPGQTAIECGYCGRRFVRRAAGAGSGQAA